MWTGIREYRTSSMVKHITPWNLWRRYLVRTQVLFRKDFKTKLCLQHRSRLSASRTKQACNPQAEHLGQIDVTLTSIWLSSESRMDVILTSSWPRCSAWVKHQLRCRFDVAFETKSPSIRTELSENFYQKPIIFWHWEFMSFASSASV